MRRTSFSLYYTFLFIPLNALCIVHVLDLVSCGAGLVFLLCGWVLGQALLCRVEYQGVDNTLWMGEQNDSKWVLKDVKESSVDGCVVLVHRMNSDNSLVWTKST
ncbi:hypothetical protein F5X96DRAFT_662411 [Biscogniauxia mediterranea]|nr:hypothetical protein F5X96DRAFT_662411 [Biscogniauxia mediterranea]